MKFLKFLFLMILLCSSSFAGIPPFSNAPGVNVKNGGTSQGQATSVNCDGTTMTCTMSGATVTLSSSGGSGGSGTNYWLYNGNVGIGTYSPYNVGIGTISPTQAFTVGSTNQFNVDSSGNVNTSGTVGIGASSMSFSAPNLSITPSTGSILVTSGNLSINTTTATEQLMVYGTGQTTSAITDAGSQSATVFAASSGIGAGAGGAVTFGAQTTSNGTLNQAAIKSLLNNGGTNGTSSLAFSMRRNIADTNLTEMMRINNNGNVGIGTTITGQGLSIMNGNVGIGTWANQSSYQEEIEGGNVGIGLNNALGGLYIGPQASGYSAYIAQNGQSNFSTVNIDEGQLNFTGGSNTLINLDGSNQAYIADNYQGGNGAIVLGVGSSNRAWFSTTGNVGIGSSNPGQALDVFGTVRDIGEIVNGNVGIGTSTPQGGLVVTNGNVGIGTWSPAFQLDALGTVRTGGFFLASSVSSPTVTPGNCGGATATVATDATDWGGNVGIGTIATTTCILNFAYNHPHACYCTCAVQVSGAGAICYQTTKGTNSTTFTVASTSSKTLNYVCGGC